jgi:hypothetical protein
MGFFATSIVGLLGLVAKGAIFDTVKPARRSALRADIADAPSMVPWTIAPCLFFA